ncbi:MAG: hypothetical protein K2F79_04270 [Muribaculaceae bacterium]|nr:hypothetical protein [Muribaculaceae bacterium]
MKSSPTETMPYAAGAAMDPAEVAAPMPAPESLSECPESETESKPDELPSEAADPSVAVYQNPDLADEEDPVPDPPILRNIRPSFWDLC